MRKVSVLQVKDREWWKEERKPAEALKIVRRKKALSNKYFTVQQVCDRLSVSQDVIYEHIRKGFLEVQPIGRIYRIAEEALESYLTEQALQKRS